MEFNTQKKMFVYNNDNNIKLIICTLLPIKPIINNIIFWNYYILSNIKLLYIGTHIRMQNAF